MVVTRPDEDPLNQEIGEIQEEEEENLWETGVLHSANAPKGTKVSYAFPGGKRAPGIRPDGGAGSMKIDDHYHYDYVDNDPHFVVEADGSPLPVCFDVMGKIGNIFQLLHDPVLNITVNGLVIGKVNHNVRKQKTYLGQIGISVAGTTAVITPDSIRVNNQERRWKKAGSTFRVGPLSFTFENKHFLRVSCGHNVTFAVIRHLIKNPNKMDFMGIYIEEDEGLSDNPYGLLGQFKDLRVRIQENTGTVTRGNKVKKTGTMTFPQFINRKSVRVFEGQRLNMASKQHTKCWYVRNNGRGLLEGKIQNYRVPNLLHDRLASGLARRFTI